MHVMDTSITVNSVRQGLDELWSDWTRDHPIELYNGTSNGRISLQQHRRPNDPGHWYSFMSHRRTNQVVRSNGGCEEGISENEASQQGVLRATKPINVGAAGWLF